MNLADILNRPVARSRPVQPPQPQKQRTGSDGASSAAPARGLSASASASGSSSTSTFRFAPPPPCFANARDKVKAEKVTAAERARTAELLARDEEDRRRREASEALLKRKAEIRREIQKANETMGMSRDSAEKAAAFEKVKRLTAEKKKLDASAPPAPPPAKKHLHPPSPSPSIRSSSSSAKANIGGIKQPQQQQQQKQKHRVSLSTERNVSGGSSKGGAPPRLLSPPPSSPGSFFSFSPSSQRPKDKLGSSVNNRPLTPGSSASGAGRPLTPSSSLGGGSGRGGVGKGPGPMRLSVPSALSPGPRHGTSGSRPSSSSSSQGPVGSGSGPRQQAVGGRGGVPPRGASSSADGQRDMRRERERREGPGGVRRRPAYREEELRPWEIEIAKELDDFIVDDEEEADAAPPHTVKALLRRVTGYDPRRYAHIDAQGDVQESSFMAVDAEEQRSRRLGILEDEEELRKEMQREAEKRKRKEDRSGGKEDRRVISKPGGAVREASSSAFKPRPVGGRSSGTSLTSGSSKKFSGTQPQSGHAKTHKSSTGPKLSSQKGLAPSASKSNGGRYT
uniref:SPT2 chromatin protein n=1 Tax=Chromera velia CCMP2878 TaxID=1169474 RepID=A0A0G4HKR7_9ALVE|eukprot:Cvel_7256.t1-p1 / transcript=Cvel_7256.t1 / gene=Cvel_7256 / organism=Chromera_velia_CCMP2878 / gene_product=hypothetical protein / transcript_product=hypothetical protein / location=Cvel_scaffold374:83915-89120(+) / protein_length=564 / sequence_SO=supercontig / SO=protein_coding / is_pseudo=false